MSELSAETGIDSVGSIHPYDFWLVLGQFWNLKKQKNQAKAGSEANLARRGYFGALRNNFYYLAGDLGAILASLGEPWGRIFGNVLACETGANFGSNFGANDGVPWRDAPCPSRRWLGGSDGTGRRV